jgi:hypothetical protein
MPQMNRGAILVKGPATRLPSAVPIGHERGPRRPIWGGGEQSARGQAGGVGARTMKLWPWLYCCAGWPPARRGRTPLPPTGLILPALSLNPFSLMGKPFL